MPTIYYVTATAPATIFVAGKYAQLSPGQSSGPFTEEEINLVMRSPDRRRLYVTSQESAVVPPTNIPSNSVDAYNRPEVSADAVFKDVDSEATEEPIRVTSSDVPSPLTPKEEETLKQPTKDPKAADWHTVEVKEETSSSLEPFPEEIPQEPLKSVETASTQPEENVSSTPEETSEETPEPKPRRRRRSS